MVTSPDGRAMWVPDFLAGAFTAPPAPANTPIGSPGPWDAAPLRPGDSQVMDDYGHASNGPEGGLSKADLSAQWSQPKPIPRTDAARIAQATSPIGTIRQIGQTIDPSAQPVRAPTPQWSAQDSAVLASQTAQAQAAQAEPPPEPPPLTNAEKKARAAQQAYAASPEGQIQQASGDAMAAKQAEAGIAAQSGQVEADELGDIARSEREGMRAADKVRQQTALELEERRRGLEERQKTYDDAVKAEAAYKVDDNRRYKNLGTGKQVLFWISAALSGLGDALARKGGTQNVPIQMLQQAIEQDVAAQVRDHETLGRRIGQAKNSIDNYRAITGDIREAGRLKLSEEYDRTAQQIRATAAKYGGEKAKLRGEAAAMQLEGAAAAIRGATAEGVFARDLQRQQMANQRQQTAISGGHLALARKQFDEGIRQFDKRMLLEAAQLDAAANKAAQAGKDTTAEAIKMQGVVMPPKAVKDADGNVTMEPGDVVVLPLVSKDEIPDVRKKMIANDQIMAITDEMRQIVSDSSGAGMKLGQWTGSPQQKRLEVLKQQLVLLRKQGTTGMSSDGDMARLEAAGGVKSVNDLRGALDALNEAREQQVKSINSTLYGHGYRGKKVEWADPLKTKAPMSADQEEARRIQGSRNVAVTPESLERRPGETSADMIRRSRDELSAQPAGIPPRDKQVIDTWAATVADPKAGKKQRDEANAFLGNLASSAQDPAIREYASARMSAIRQSSPGFIGSGAAEAQ